MLRVVAAVGALLLALIMAGCGQQEEGGGGVATTSSDEETTRSATTGSHGPTNITTPAQRNADVQSVGGILECQLEQATAGMSQQQGEDYTGEVLDEAMRRGKGTSMQDIISERGYDCGWTDYKAKSGRR